MGRPKQTGFEFFPFDSSFFEDIKVRKLIRGGCINATTVYISALCFVFKEGYYLRIDEDFPFLIYEKTGIAEEEVARCINKCVEVGLFDKSLYEQGILTSIGIQKRYHKICSQCRRSVSITEYNLLDDSVCKADNCGGNDASADVSSEETIEQDLFSTEEMQQRKGKKRKVTPPISDEIGPPLESSEVSISVPAKPKTLEERKQEFYNSLMPYVAKYGKEMVLDFFNYWSEVSDGVNRMAWEKAKIRKGTFNLSGRLVTWKRHQDEGYGSGRSSKRGSTISEAVQAAAIPEGSLAGQLDITKLLGQ